MGDVSLNEVIGRLTFLIRLLKVDTVFGSDPWHTMRRILITTH
jgi:hypothetical protein